MRARIDNPAFTNSAMDGFAVRAAEAAAGAPLRLVGESRAGAPFAGAVGHGEAIRISTGAVLPDDLDAILRKEDADDRGDTRGRGACRRPPGRSCAAAPRTPAGATCCCRPATASPPTRSRPSRRWASATPSATGACG